MLLLALAAASQAVTLIPGQQVTLTVKNSTVVASAPIAASLSAHERETSEALGAEGCNETNCGANGRPVGPGEMKTAPDSVTPDTIRVTFALVNGQSALVFRNQVNRMLTYRARITTHGRTAPTDVCQVLPLKSGYENWPYAIERIELSAFESSAWDGTTPPRCE
jgi:hypothetical protein